MRARVRQVAAPPVVARGGPFDALHDHQQVRVGREHGITGPLRRQPPVVRAPVAPRGRPVRLVVKVDADHGRGSRVASREQREVRDPGALGIGRGVPEAGAVGTVARLRAVVVEDDPQADLAGIGHDPVHHLEAVEPLEVGILREVDAVRQAGRCEQLVAVGQTDGVEAL